MPDQPIAAPPDRIAVVDVGSNSLRLVVFERLGDTLVPRLNEKVMCALGRGIAGSGRLHPDGIALALANMQRFVALARAHGIEQPAIIATAAVREASDGRAFVAEAERRCGVPVRVIEGGEEAQLSAAGVLAGIRDADGVVGDLGGGSVELARVDAGAAMPIGTGVSLPIGALRLAELGDGRRPIVAMVDRAIGEAAVLRQAAGKALYLVGGAWRAIARLHMEQTQYPLHIIHEYAIARRAAEDFLDIISGQSRRSLEGIASISRKRLELVPIAALILRRLIDAGQPERIVFSAFGLREGYAYGLLPAAARGDSLIAACRGLAGGQGRWAGNGDRLLRWVEPIFPGRPEAMRRLHRAACWLGDLAWADHPDYRAEHAFARAQTLPLAQIAHRERVFVAHALHARYGGPIDHPIKSATRALLDAEAAAEARALGLALRLAYTVCGGAFELLDEAMLRRGDDGVTLELPPAGSLLLGEAVQRRLEALGRALGVTGRIARRANPGSVAA